MRSLRWLTCALALLVAPLAAPAQTTPDVASLRGVRALTLLVLDVTPDLAALVDTAALRLKVELKLREHGITVLPYAGALRPDGFLELVVVSYHNSSAQEWALSGQVNFDQLVILSRPSHDTLVTSTWRAAPATVVAVDQTASTEVNAIVDDEVDQFLNAWLEANPPKW